MEPIWQEKGWPAFLNRVVEAVMKLVFDAQLLFEKQKTGIGRNAKMLIDCLCEYSDIDCTLNCFYMRDTKRTEGILESYRKKGCHVQQNYWLPARIYNHLERVFPVPYQWIFGSKADTTQFFNYTLPAGVCGKAVTIVHDMAFQAYPETVTAHTRRWLGNNLKKYCQKAACVITVSEFSRQEIHRYLDIPLEKIEVVYNGVDLKYFRPDCETSRIKLTKQMYGITKDYILYLGTLEPRKNLDTLLTAYWKLQKELPEAPMLVLAGKKKAGCTILFLNW